jgi:DNA-binding protein
LTLFFGEDKTSVTVRAAERLIEKALWVAEVLKRKVPDLHQITTINEQKIVDVFLP